jgi:hypothetical protein
MLLGRYRLACGFHDDAELPPFKGSTFRGAFGWALKRVVCALKTQQCAQCILRDRCVYCLAFETLPPDGDRRSPSPPHPFVIEPPLTEQTFFPGESPFTIDLLLFGYATEYLAYFVYAFEEMGRSGIGRAIGGRRPRFRLLRVMSEGDMVYDPGEGTFFKPVLEPIELPVLPAASSGSRSTLTVKLETPLRLKFQNRLHAEFPFHVLVRGMLRRISTLHEHFGNGEPPLDYRGLVARAEQVETVTSRLQWFDWKRYSNRQDQAMLMGGITGEITYQGLLNEFIPLIKYCETVHVGKATTFGLGKIRAQES